jgi:hypothetical protein
MMADAERTSSVSLAPVRLKHMLGVVERTHRPRAVAGAYGGEEMASEIFRYVSTLTD